MKPCRARNVLKSTTNGNINASRREIQTKRFNEAEPSGDSKFMPAEFIYWYSKGRHEAGERSRNGGARDGAQKSSREGDQRSSREGKGQGRER